MSAVGGNGNGKAAPSQPGPGEAFAFPTQLEARVVERTDGRARIHGFDVRADLARHFSFAEALLVTLTGDEPAPATARAFEVVLIHLLPRTVGEAPVHAAMLAKLSAGRGAAVLGVGGIGLAEEAAARLATHEPLLAWLATRDGPLPSAFACASAEERDAVDELRAALATADETMAPLPDTIGYAAALLAVLHAIGLRQPWQLEAVLMLAGLPALAAEAAQVKQYALRSYPFNLPPVVYDPGVER